MTDSPEDKKPTDNMELLKQQASCCGSSCSCHTTPAKFGMLQHIIGIVVLIAAGVLVVRAVIKSNQTQTQKPAPALTAQIMSQGAEIKTIDGKKTTKPSAPAETKSRSDGCENESPDCK